MEIVIHRQGINANDDDMNQRMYGFPNKPSAHVPHEFSDPSTITAPANLQDLIQQLHTIFAHDDISVEYVQKLMAEYISNRNDWKQFAKWDPHRYTRNLVDEGNGKFNLMILCWNEGQGSSIHSHADSHCFLKVLEGAVKEEMFSWPAHLDGSPRDHEIPAGQEGEMEATNVTNVLEHNQCGYINDSMGLHRVENNSHSDKAITLHLYSPPFQECQVFDQRTSKTSSAKMTFWSKFGKRTPFGKPEQPTPPQAENN